jgi:Icc-related predicted phosphoesterase
MRLVIVSDLHGQLKTLKYLNDIIEKEKPGGIIIPGDITHRDDVTFLEKLFEIIRKRKVEAFVISGNSDGANAQKTIDESSYSINLQSKKIDNYNIYGISETEDFAIPDSSKISGSILVTHRPPLKSLLNQKFSNAPKFHINGHIHSGAYVKHYPSTVHIQVPTLQTGRYATFDTHSYKVEFLSI